MTPETYRARLLNLDGSTAGLVERELVNGAPEVKLEMHEQRTADTVAVIEFKLSKENWVPGQEAIYRYSNGRHDTPDQER
jgi:hypothetical protein